MSATASPAPPAAPRSAVVAVVGHATPFPVRRIYCVGRNYLEHIREMREGDERDPPFFFQKPADAIVPDGGRIPYPPATGDLQHEVELVVAIGGGGRDLPVSRALDEVYGYAVGIDLTRRDRQRESFAKGLPWEIGKAFDHSAPCGNVHPAADVGHRLTGEIRLSVNGELRQSGDLRQMIWNVPEIVAQLSRLYTLAPGDLVMTGTPAGVGAVRPGDRIEASIEGLSPLTVTIVDAEE